MLIHRFLKNGLFTNKMIVISVIVPAINEADNIGTLVQRIKETAEAITKKYEIIVVDGNSTDNTVINAKKSGAKVLVQHDAGFGGALRDGFAAAKGDYIITIDGDLSHEPEMIKTLWEQREHADIVIASRYVHGGSAVQSRMRKFLSRSLNIFFSLFLSIPAKDTSSNFRMYTRSVLEELDIECTKFDVLQEILVLALSKGFTIKEVPMHYQPRQYGVSKAKIMSFVNAYSATFVKLWSIRNSIQSCDYDERAYYSIIPLQRYWQRKRYDIVMHFLKENNLHHKKILDIGCGTSKIIQDMPLSVAMDIQFHKLRYLRKSNPQRLQASTFSLPFQDASFDVVISSQVIEHIPYKQEIFTEISRVLHPGGVLILGTPDYGTITWNVAERIYKLFPNTYGDEYITHYDLKQINQIFKDNSFEVLDVKYVCGAEMIIVAKKSKLSNSNR